MNSYPNVQPEGPRDYGAFTQAAGYIGSAPRALTAQARADHMTYEQVRRGNLTDTLDLYAGHPSPCSQINLEVLARAYAHFQERHMERVQQQGHMPATLHERDLITRSIHDAFDALQHRPWAVLNDDEGTLEIAGSKHGVYLVSDHLCISKGRYLASGEAKQCPSQQFWRGRHGGECYHTVARELVRLAQVFTQRTESAVPLTTRPTATFTVAARTLGYALGTLAGADQAVFFSIKNNRFRAYTGERSPINAVMLSAPTIGTALVELDAQAFARLWSQFRSVAAKLNTVEVLIDADNGLVAIAEPNGTFAVVVEGTRELPAA